MFTQSIAEVAINDLQDWKKVSRDVSNEHTTQSMYILNYSSIMQLDD